MNKENTVSMHSLISKQTPQNAHTIIQENISKKQTHSIVNKKINYFEFMKKHKSTGDYTHTSFVGGKWLINDDELDLFYELYAKEIENNKQMHITEKHQPKYSPIIIDFDFKYTENIKSPLTIKVINNIIKNISDMVKQSFVESEDFTCIVTKRPAPYFDQKSKKYKDGIHIIFPNIVTSFDYQYMLRTEYLKIMGNDIEYVLKHCDQNDIELESIYDKSVIEDNNWFLYMSTKPHIPPYIIYKVYNSNMQVKNMNISDIIKLMSIRNKVHMSTKSDKYDEFMMDYYNKKCDSEVKSDIKKEVVAINTNTDIITQLLFILAPKRNDEFKKWIKIGFIFHNLQKTDNIIDYFSIWKEWSKQSGKYNDGCCENLWGKIKLLNNGLSIGSLYYYAKKDNSEEYKKIIAVNNNNNININKSDVCELDKLYQEEDRGYIKMYYNKYKDDLVCTSQEAHIFLMYNETNQLWQPKTIKDIQNHFMDNMKQIIKPLANHYKNKADEIRNSNSDKAKVYDKKVMEILYTSEFYKASKSKPLMPLIESQFYNQTIMKQMNNDKDLLPVKNGVINLKTGEFRERTKYDYFSFELSAEWKGLEYETPDINKFFSDIMLNSANTVAYLQKILGYSITGYINEQKFVIMWGNGGNGKGVLQNLLKTLLCDYYRQLTSDVIMESRKNTAGSASPHLMQLFGARLAFVDESEMGGKLNEGVVKSVTGGSAITARPLYSNPITFEPTHQLFLLTNYKPEINVNPSNKRRLVLIPFLAEFRSVSDFDPNNKRHILGNKDIELELLTKLDQLLVWLVNGSVKYFKDGLDDIPDQITDATKEYLNENDDLGNLLEELCDKDVNGFVYHCDLFEKYKEESGKNISAKMFTSMMKEKGYITIRRNAGMLFKGIKLKDNVLDT